MSPSPDMSILSFAEYLVIFNTFVFGYVATQFFTGWSSVISHREKLVISVEHLIWTIFAFGMLTDIWWGGWSRTARITEHNYYFYISLITPVVFYMLTVFLFPDPDNYSQGDLVTYLSREFKRIAFFFLLLFLSFFVNSIFFGDVLAADLYFNILGAGLSLLAMLYRAVWLRRLILVFGITALLFHLWLRTSYQPGHYVLGFSFVEYLTVFITFVYGFVASRFLYGWGVMLKGIKKIKISTQHVAWTILAFGLMMDMWWNSWYRGTFIEASIGNFLLSLSVPLMFYFFSATLFPVELMQTGYTNLKAYFEKHKLTTYALLGLIMLSNFLIANISSGDEMFTTENLLRVLSIALAAVALIYREVWYQRFVLLLAWSFLILHSLILAG
jgi:hypothetical protein